MNQPKTTAPNLASSSMLVVFSVKFWEGRTMDRQAGAEIATINKAHPDMANVHKNLLPTCKELVELKKFARNARNRIHYHLTLPWTDAGLRVIPTTLYFEYNRQMPEASMIFAKLVQKFFDAYEWSVIQAETEYEALGKLFKKEEYPSVDTLRGKFSWTHTYLPMPDAGDFRVDIGNEQADAIREQCAEYYSTMFHQAIQEIAEPLKNMSERLDYSNGEDKKVFRDTLVSNVLTAIDLLGVTTDPKFVKIKQELDHAFTGITPDALREDPYLRRTTKQAVDNAIASLDF